jgi:hypothetical protein
MSSSPDVSGKNSGHRGLNIFGLALEYTGKIERIKITASALEAADAAQVVGAFFRLNIILTKFMALEAVGAFINIEPYEESRDAIEQRKYRSERA